MLKGPVILLSLLFASLAEAVEIAFFIRKNANGVVETYEEGTLYSHVAIRVGDEWLEARPWHGVRLIDDPSEMGTITEILFDPNIPEPDEFFLDEVLGKKYFLFADWNDPEVYNCTKLVAKYLGIPPNPMHFDPLIWGDRFHEYLGKPGLSVAELYTELSVTRNYESKTNSGCKNALK